MKTEKERKPNRLKNYNYAGCGHYFITSCVENRIETLSSIDGNGNNTLRPEGIIVRDTIESVTGKYPDFQIDEYVIMPNHIHMIVVIKTGNDLGKKSISDFVAHVKAVSSRTIKKKSNTNFAWQRSFYDHIIRDEKGYKNIKKYIVENPLQWAVDIENVGGDAEKYYKDIIIK